MHLLKIKVISEKIVKISFLQELKQTESKSTKKRKYQQKKKESRNQFASQNLDMMTHIQH